MAPPQLASTTISPSDTNIVLSSLTLNLGENAYLRDSIDGFNTVNLPITTESVLNVGTAINVHNKSDGTSNLTIGTLGDVNTSGYITASGDITTGSTLYGNQLHIGGDNCIISDAGLVTMQSDLKIQNVGSDTFKVTASTGDISTQGALSVVSTTNLAGTVTVGNTSSTNYNIQLSNTGAVTAKGDLNIGSDLQSTNFVVSAASGAITAQSDLTIQNATATTFKVTGLTGATTAQGDLKIQSSGTDKFTVTALTGAITAKGDLHIGSDTESNNFIATASGTITAQNDLKIQNAGVDKFAVTALTGAITTHDSLTMKNSDEITTFSLTGSSGNVSMGTTDANGTISTTYKSYVHPDSYSNTALTDDTVTKTSATSSLLTTQEYVDDAIWQQTKRLNLIVGSNDTSLATFSNMFNMAKTLAGQDAIQTLSGLLDTTGEIKTSVSTVMNRAYNPISVNCCSAVWRDECPPMPIPRTISGVYGTNGMDGWYFQNLQLTDSANQTSASKINWYLPANGSAMKVKHLLNMFLNMYAVSNNSLPFISILTAPKGDSSDLLSGYYNANINFYFGALNPSLTCNKNYTLYTGQETPANTYNSTLLRCFSSSTKNFSNKTQNNNLGTITQVSSSTTFLNSFDTTIVSPEDNIVAFIIQTASTATKGDVNLVINNFNVESHDTTDDNSRDIINGTTKFMFSNSSVSSNYHYNLFHQTHMDFTPITGTKSELYYKSYNKNVRG